jgi:hypothetical protein
MEVYISHEVKEMDESRLQKCIHCNAVMADFRYACWPLDQPAPKGWAPGRVLVYGNTFHAESAAPEGLDIVKCEELF